MKYHFAGCRGKRRDSKNRSIPEARSQNFEGRRGAARNNFRCAGVGGAVV
jgi:hypothetical protein